MDWFEYSKILLDKCKEREIPLHAGFELTPLCNFNCSMCYIHLTPEQANAQGKLLTTDQWIHIAREAKKLGALSMELTGGEAMTRPDFCTLYKEFAEMGYLILLRTNGYLINSEKIEFFKKYKPRKIMITMYGASDETYKRFCGVYDGFTVVTRNILALRDAGIRVQLTATITKENNEDAEKMEKWAKDNGFSLDLCGMLFTPVRGAKRSVDHLKVRLPDEAYELTEEMRSLPREIENRDYYMNPFWMCRSFGAKFAITWDGKMTMCYSNPSVWKDPLADGVDKAYHELYRDLKTIKRPKECSECKYIDLCAVCPSMLYSSTGSMENTCEEMCRMARRKYKTLLTMNVQSSGEKDPDFTKECEEGD